MKLARVRAGAILLFAALLQSCGGGYEAVLDELPGEGELIVNVNTATEAELITIPGIAEILAREIIRERPYERVEDLIRVKGIGQYKLNSIRPYVKVEGKTERR